MQVCHTWNASGRAADGWLGWVGVGVDGLGYDYGYGYDTCTYILTAYIYPALYMCM